RLNCQFVLKPRKKLKASSRVCCRLAFQSLTSKRAPVHETQRRRLPPVRCSKTPMPNSALALRQPCRQPRSSTKTVRSPICVLTQLIYQSKLLRQQPATSSKPLVKTTHRCGPTLLRISQPKKRMRPFDRLILLLNRLVLITTTKNSTTLFV